MTNFAQKLMSAAQAWSSDASPVTPNPLAKITHSPQKSLFRIGLWPIISTEEPEIGPSIGLVLAALLEQWPSVCVYRLLAKVDDNPSDFQWKIQDSQFGVDDWEIEGLDENVAIWGSLEVQGERFKLSLEVENDAREDDSVFELGYDAASLVEILNQLPALAIKIMGWLSEADSVAESQYESITTVNTQLVKDFLEDVFHWELDYFRDLWGQGSDAENVLDSQNSLVEIANDLDCDFGAWIMAQSISRFILFDQTNWSGWLLPSVKETAASLNKYPVVTHVLADTLFRANDNLEAFDVLETNLALHPEDTKAWVALGDFYVKSGEDLSAIDIYQRAIEGEVEASEIYLAYAGLMDSLVEHQIDLREGTSRVSAAGRPFYERYVFADSTENALSLRESCEAYRHVVELDASNIDALAHLVIDLLSLQDAEAWRYCIQLIDSDKEGTLTASVVEQLEDSEMEQMAGILRDASAKKPQEFSLHLNLARIYLALDEPEKAKDELGSISIDKVPPQFQSITARLRLAADNPDFDARLGEMRDILDAKGQPNSEDIELLEAAIEKEPLYAEGYRLLAQSYLSLDEADDALEVLLDGQKVAPFDSELVTLLANVLWDADEPDLAFAYLEQGLTHNNRDATLLSLMGRFLFDDGKDESAKEYLRRAEAVDPLNAELSSTRSYIANSFIKGKSAK